MLKKAAANRALKDDALKRLKSAASLADSLKKNGKIDPAIADAITKKLTGKNRGGQ